MAETLPHMFSRGAKASHKRKLELAAKKPKRTHTKKPHRKTVVRDEELHEHNTAVTEAEQRRLAAEREANDNQDKARGTGGRRRTRRRRGVLARLVRNPTRRQLKALLGRRGGRNNGTPEQEYTNYYRIVYGTLPSEEVLKEFRMLSPDTQRAKIEELRQMWMAKNPSRPRG